jgi:hypothetical protein
MTSYIGASPETTISRVRYLYTAVTAQDTFTTATDGQVLSYESTNNVDVYVNGVLLTPTTDYAAETGSSIVLVDAAVANDKVEVLTYESFQVANYLPTTGGTVNGNVNVTGDLTVDTNTLHVDSTNNWVGIGTSSPSRELEVTGSGNVYIKVSAPTANDSAGIELANTGGTWLIQNDDTSSEALTFDRAGTERLRIESDGGLKHLSKPAYFARAWVNFKGTGTVTIRDDGNVSSISDYGVGYYGVNFTEAFQDADYSAVITGGRQGNSTYRATTACFESLGTLFNYTTTQCRFKMVGTSAGGTQDSVICSAAFFR